MCIVMYGGLPKRFYWVVLRFCDFWKLFLSQDFVYFLKYKYKVFLIVEGKGRESNKKKNQVFVVR